MKIERINGLRLKELGNIKWTFPAGPVFLLLKEESQQKVFTGLLRELFSPQKPLDTVQPLGSSSVFEMWVSRENHRFHIRQNYQRCDNDLLPTSNLITDEVTGENVSLADTMSLGEFIFGVNLQVVQLGVTIDWSEVNDVNQLYERIENFSLSGDERLSPQKVKASLIGAQNKVLEQKGKIALVKAEYDALRKDWENSHRQQEEERLLLIELKEFEENDAILAEKITAAHKISERLTLLNQNPDYRELRRLQTDIISSEERLQRAEANLAALTNESVIDWVLVEGLREECIRWADLQAQIKRLDHIIQKLGDRIANLKVSIQTSGYEGSHNEKQRMYRLLEEKNTAQDKLNSLADFKKDLADTQLSLSQAAAELQELSEMTSVTQKDEARVARWEWQLRKWHNSIIGRTFEHTLLGNISRFSIEKKLRTRIKQYYEILHVKDFEGFQNRLAKFHELKNYVERLQEKIIQLRNVIAQEEILRETVDSRNDSLNEAFFAANADNFSLWLEGWKDCNKKIFQLSHLQKKQESLSDRYVAEDTILRDFTAELKEKLNHWNTPVTDREEVLAMVFDVAHQLREKDRAEKRMAEYKLKFVEMIGDRDLDTLANKIEPLAELDKEALISSNDRQSTIASWEIERLEISRLRQDTQKRLKSMQKYPSLAALEEKMEASKQEWMTYENLLQAINDTLRLFEMSTSSWQATYGNALYFEATRILKQFSSIPDIEMSQKELLKAKREYFAYRMAIAQLALSDNFEIPLFLSIEKLSEDGSLLTNITEYLSELSPARQIILSTTNLKFAEKLKNIGWTSIIVQS